MSAMPVNKCQQWSQCKYYCGDLRHRDAGRPPYCPLDMYLDLDEAPDEWRDFGIVVPASSTVEHP